MTKTLSITALQRLSPRERALAAIAVALLVIALLVYGVLLPGLSAARSAGDRYLRAIDDLASTQSLVALIGSPGPDAGSDFNPLRLSAEAAGLVVTDFHVSDGSLDLQVEAQTAGAVLAWIARITKTFPPRTLTIAAVETGVTAQLHFGGAPR